MKARIIAAPLALIPAATVLCLLTVVSSALAHHSHALFYDPCTNVTIEGQVESIEWKNPHTLIDLKTNDGAAYRAEWTSLQVLTNMGVAARAQEMLKVGDRVVVTGNLGRDAAQIRARVPAFTEWPQKTVDVMSIRRAGDSWSWAATSPPRCAQK
jgi:hypothetical protein